MFYLVSLQKTPWVYPVGTGSGERERGGEIIPFSQLVELLLVRHSNASLRLFCSRFTWFTEILSYF